MKIIVALAMLVLCFVSCHTLNERVGLKNDHPLEEMFEEIIEDHTGLDIDLSLESPE